VEDKLVDFGDLPHGIEDVHIIMRGSFSVASSYDCPRDRQHQLRAVVLAEAFGEDSVDAVHEEFVIPYEDQIPELPAELQPIVAGTRAAKEFVRSAIGRVLAIKDKPDHPGLFGAGAALLRLPMTFRLATLAVRNGFHFETAILARMIVEQLAWAVSVHQHSGDAMFAIEPQKCISRLKEYFPDAGRLYGSLSEGGHLVPQRTLRYIEFANTTEPTIHLVSLSFGLEDTALLLQLADMYAVVTEVVYSELLVDLKHVVRIDGRISPRADRPGVQLLGDWQQDFAGAT
jgi:hypothetical protein